jgi:hypothetical protein
MTEPRWPRCRQCQQLALPGKRCDWCYCPFARTLGVTGTAILIYPKEDTDA